MAQRTGTHKKKGGKSTTRAATRARAGGAGAPAPASSKGPAAGRGGQSGEARGGRTVVLVAAATSFTVSLVLFLVTLAPGVTFEDSGELISAAKTLGVPHEPGYPLWTMIAHLFTLLPFGTVAWRVNLMSALCTALAAALLAWVALLLIDELAAHPTGVDVANGWLFPTLGDPARWLACAGAVAAALAAATALTTWQQSIITEVYGLDALLVSILLLLVVLWSRAPFPRGRRRLFYAVCVTLGLGLTTHDTFVVLLPVVAIYGLLIERRLRPSWRQLAAGAGLFFLGLLPYLYLPLAAARHPAMDWGTPDTWTTFWRVVRRQQYFQSGHSGLGDTARQLWWSAHLLWQQWWILVLVAALAGLVVLFRDARRWFWFAVLYLVAALPLTTIVTDFKVATSNAALNVEDKALVEVFYIPAWILIGLLAGIGLWWAAAWTARRVKGTAAARAATAALVAAVVLVVLVPALLRVDDVSMHRYRFADAYIHNVFTATAPQSLVIGDRDQFTFPLMYAQMVEGRRPDVVALDQE
ncbi:MAG TPA: DUF2723 domain-containing protein, partial [Thermoleophilia bacterium]|nr:DUF2723 domain-containing protein [Thermoleophilia bacterium]